MASREVTTRTTEPSPKGGDQSRRRRRRRRRWKGGASLLLASRLTCGAALTAVVLELAARLTRATFGNNLAQRSIRALLTTVFPAHDDKRRLQKIIALIAVWFLGAATAVKLGWHYTRTVMAWPLSQIVLAVRSFVLSAKNRLTRGPKVAQWTMPFEIVCETIRGCSHGTPQHLLDSPRTALMMAEMLAVWVAPITSIQCWVAGTHTEAVAVDALETKSGLPLHKIRCIWLWPNGCARADQEVRADDLILFYVHGGGFAFCNVDTHRTLAKDLCREIATETGLRVVAFMVDYRLAPVHRFPAAIHDIVASYSWLLKKGVDPKRVVFGGDSAGGGLTLSAFLMLRDRGLPMPAGGVCLSPLVDLDYSRKIYQEAHCDYLSKATIKAAARWYLGDDVDPREPLASPLYGDLSGLPRLLIQVGGRELFLSECVRVSEIARAQNTHTTLEVYDGMPHAFQAFRYIQPSARSALRNVGRWCRSVLGFEGPQAPPITAAAAAAAAECQASGERSNQLPNRRASGCWELRGEAGRSLSSDSQDPDLGIMLSRSTSMAPTVKTLEEAYSAAHCDYGSNFVFTGGALHEMSENGQSLLDGSRVQCWNPADVARVSGRLTAAHNFLKRSASQVAIFET